MSEFSAWRACLERAGARLRALDSATQPLPPAETQVELSAVVSSIRKTLPKAMRQFLSAKRPPPPEKTDLGRMDLAELKRLTALWLIEDGLSELGSRVGYTLAFVLDRGHAHDGELKGERVRAWLSTSQDFLDAIEPQLT